MKLIKISIAFLMILLIGGCGIKIPHSKNVAYDQNLSSNKKAKLLVKRFVEYWDARVRGDAKKSWEYELPYQKYLTDFQTYRKLLTGYEKSQIVLKRIIFQNNNKALIEREVFIGHKEKVNKKDKWYYVKDNWYHKFYQSALPPKTVEEAKFQ